MTAQEAFKHTNNLIHATSPYLLQHAHNPVDWNEWGEPALTRARSENKPIFLSIGYAACHWCHVMERESFESEDIAAVLNANFIGIKVDREERPDIDAIYMQITQAMNHGRGGWPMSVFLTPEQKPFFAGTYFPPAQFKSLIERIAALWKDNRPALISDADRAAAYLSTWAEGPPAANQPIPRELIDATARMLVEHFDLTHGGFESDGNKFPPSLALMLMLRVYRRTGEARLLEAVRATLDAMARGGIYDHVGGGICRYSTDPFWHAPHFEKMLYDQALVAGAYLDGWLATREAFYGDVVRDMLDYVLGDLRSPEGAFFSSRDADSDGFEGAYYLWTVEQIVEALGAEEAALCCEYYGVTSAGNWQEQHGHAPPGPKNILHVQEPLDSFAAEHGMTRDAMRDRLRAWRAKLAAARARRTPPGLDDKILSDWNGLMIAALARAGAALDEPRYLDVARAAARFILDHMRADGRLRKSFRLGKAPLPAQLEDYAFVVEGLLNLFEADGDARWLSAARELTGEADEHLFDRTSGAYMHVSGDAELLVRARLGRDGAIPSGNAVMASNLLRLGALMDESARSRQGERILASFGQEARSQPAAYERMLIAADWNAATSVSVVVIGERGAAGTRALIRAVHEACLPRAALLPAQPGESDTSPLVKGKPMVNGVSTAYACVGSACQPPVTTAARLADQLRAIYEQQYPPINK